MDHSGRPQSLFTMIVWNIILYCKETAALQIKPAFSTNSLIFLNESYSLTDKELWLFNLDIGIKEKKVLPQ